MTDIGRLAGRFAYVRDSLFPEWDNERLWGAVVGGGLTETGFMGQCDDKKLAIRIRSDLVDLPDDELDALIAHEICHAIGGEHKDPAWKTEMVGVSCRAQEASREVLAELITCEIGAYREGECEVVNDEQGKDAASLTSALLDAKQVAKYLSISPSLFYRLVSSGRAPGPVRLGGAVRWRKQELDEWLAAGTPPRMKWKSLKREASASPGSRSRPTTRASRTPRLARASRF